VVCDWNKGNLEPTGKHHGPPPNPEHLECEEEKYDRVEVLWLQEKAVFVFFPEISQNVICWLNL